jgi:hypothetical protein
MESLMGMQRKKPFFKNTTFSDICQPIFNRINTTNGNSANKKKEDVASDSNSSLEQISPWLVGNDAGSIISGKKEKEKSKIPQMRTVITTEL